jgi:quercetin dioxygenase-like cupin family protein
VTDRRAHEKEILVMIRAFVSITLAFAALLLPGVAVAQAPPGPEVILDNPSVRVTVRTFAPGMGSGRHQGLEPEVGIVTEGDLALESPLGRSVIRQGGAYWLPGLTPHDTRNEGTRPAKLIEIFLKRCD